MKGILRRVITSFDDYHNSTEYISASIQKANEQTNEGWSLNLNQETGQKTEIWKWPPSRSKDKTSRTGDSENTLPAQRQWGDCPITQLFLQNSHNVASVNQCKLRPITSLQISSNWEQEVDNI